MKLLRNEMICYYPKGKYPEPLRFRWRDYIVSVDKVFYSEQSQFAGMPLITYSCCSYQNNKELLMELKYSLDEARWYLYKIE